MNSSELLLIRDEVAGELAGLMFGRVYALSRDSFAIDFHPHAGRYLYVDVSARRRRVHLIRRRLKSLEREATNPAPFLLKLRDTLSNQSLSDVVAEASCLRCVFGNRMSLVVDIGRSTRNVLLVSRQNLIEAALLQIDKTHHRIGEVYATHEDAAGVSAGATSTEGESLSDALDRHYLEIDRQEEFEKLAAKASRNLVSEISKRKRLLANLASDSSRHGDPENWKRLGDLLLANIATARREGDRLFVTDYFSDDTQEIVIEGDSNREIPEIAEAYFRKYTKSRNAAAVIAERISSITGEIASLQDQLNKVAAATETRDAEFLREAAGEKEHVQKTPQKKKETELKGVRRFVSSDGFEILVGKKATDNDYLSFRIAKSLDLWMHAADYSGSHVVVRNPNRKEIPHRTLIEAAELAAFYSTGRKQTKAAVNYTQKKYINKPRRGAPGLVSLSDFKTVLVVPQVRLKSE